MEMSSELTRMMEVLDTLSDVSSSSDDSCTVAASRTNLATSSSDSGGYCVGDLATSTEVSAFPCAAVKHNRLGRATKARRKNNLPKPNMKYWRRRYDLFERFDIGIEVDEESWFSVTPEVIARQQAIRCSCDFIIDLFAGAGGNSIQFAQTCGLVLSVDNNFCRLHLLQNNANVYGVNDRIMLICADGAGLLHALRVNPVNSVEPVDSSAEIDRPNPHTPSQLAGRIFMSPPWGGPGLSGDLVLPPGSSSWKLRQRRQWLSEHSEEIDQASETVNLDVMGQTLYPALRAARHLCDRLLLYLPRNSSIGQLLQLGWSSLNSCGCHLCCKDLKVSIEEYWLRGRRMALGVNLSGV